MKNVPCESCKAMVKVDKNVNEKAFAIFCQKCLKAMNVTQNKEIKPSIN